MMLRTRNVEMNCSVRRGRKGGEECGALSASGGGEAGRAEDQDTYDEELNPVFLQRFVDVELHCARAVERVQRR